MLDPKHLQSVLEKSAKLSQDAQEKMTTPFSEGMSKMEINGADSARDIMQTVNRQCQSILNDMNGILRDLQDNVDAHQKMQSAEVPKDFQQAMNDLRETTAKGFPEELSSFFDRVPKV